ncbi:MAG: hypothetical protein QM729_21085 [Solirubrobacterales bacterium]
MIRRLRVLLERPHDPEVARQVVLLAMVVTVGLACLLAASVGDGRHPTDHHLPSASTEAAGRPASPSPLALGRRSAPLGPVRPQDPQDRPGTPAHRRAEHALAGHRALQHVPWHQGGVSIALVGARAGKAVLAVSGPGLVAERRAWRAFLHRFRDDGSAYVPRFRASGGRGGR